MPKKINVVSLSHIKPVEEDDVNQIKEAIRLEEAQTPLVEELVIVKPKRKPPAKKVIEVIEQLPKGVLGSSNDALCEEQLPLEVVDSSNEPEEEQLPKGVLGSSNDQLPKEDTKKIKTVELVKCPKCDKEMTKRTLRYDHDKTCPGQKVEREKMPVQRRVKVKTIEKKEVVEHKVNIPEELIEEEVKKRIQNHVHDRMHQKMKLKEERIKKLASQIV